MATVNDVYELLNLKFPYFYADSWDNSGIICGSLSKKISKILVSLDITFDVIDECINSGCDLIVSHHPIVFSPLKSVTDNGYEEKKLFKMIEKNIAAISCHTNLDVALNGVNDTLAGVLRLSYVRPVCQEENGSHIARMGYTGIKDINKFAAFVKEKLGCNAVRFVNAGVPVEKVAVIGGSGGSYYEQVLAAGADTLVTGDAKYSNFLPCFENKLNVIDAGHFYTENIIVAPLAKLLSEKFAVPVLESKANKNIIEYI